MRIIKAVAIFAIAAFSPALMAAHLQDQVDLPVGVKFDGSAFQAEEVQEAIVTACHGRGWTPRLESPGMIVATILVRGRHFAEVEIPFTAQAFSIRYRSSRELDYNPEKRTIHRNYNKWVVLLSRDITTTLGTLGARTSQSE